jgi:CHASE2 domain-containing sensor protein
VMMTIRNTGSVFGVAIFGTIVVQVVIGMMAYRHVVAASPDVISTGFSFAFSIGIILCLAGACISAAVRDERIMV